MGRIEVATTVRASLSRRDRRRLIILLPVTFSNVFVGPASHAFRDLSSTAHAGFTYGHALQAFGSGRSPPRYHRRFVSHEASGERHVSTSSNNRLAEKASISLMNCFMITLRWGTSDNSSRAFGLFRMSSRIKSTHWSDALARH
jgi:hypothetical protein